MPSDPIAQFALDFELGMMILAPNAIRAFLTQARQCRFDQFEPLGHHEIRVW
jgi:hypothetical protein